MKKTNVKTKVIAGIMAAICSVSALGALSAVGASAAVVNSAPISAQAASKNRRQVAQCSHPLHNRQEPQRYRRSDRQGVYHKQPLLRIIKLTTHFFINNLTIKSNKHKTRRIILRVLLLKTFLV